MREPVSVIVELFGSGIVAGTQIEDAVKKVFNLTPQGIIKHLNLLPPIFRQTSHYGHFGSDIEGFSWEKTDKKEELKKSLR